MTTQNSWGNQVLDANVTFNGGTFSAGTDATSDAINIATGAAARATTIGNITGASSLDLKFGTGDFTLDVNSGTSMHVFNTGEITKPLQPSFMAYVNANVANVTGNGAEYKICDDNNTTSFDDNSDYDNDGVFTAPVNGRYQFNGYCKFFGECEPAMTAFIYKIITSNQDIILLQGTAYVPSPTIVGVINKITNGSSFFEMDAADTAHVTIKISNGSGDVMGVQGSVSPSLVRYVYISIYLVC